MLREVYTTHAGPGLQAVLYLLRKNGIVPTVLDDPDPVLLQKAYFHCFIRIAVEDCDFERAVSILAEWEKESAAGIGRTSRDLHVFLLKCLILSVGISLTSAMFVHWETAITIFAVSLLPSLLLVSITDGMKRKRAGKHGKGREKAPAERKARH